MPPDQPFTETVNISLLTTTKSGFSGPDQAVESGHKIETRGSFRGETWGMGPALKVPSIKAPGFPGVKVGALHVAA
jgi:hypothetical protein